MNQKTKRFWVFSILLGAAYGASLRGEFLNWDDLDLIVFNPQLRHVNAQSLQWMSTTLWFGNYHPLSWLSLALDNLWGRNGPFAFRFTNLILHLLNTLVFCSIADWLFQKKNGGPTRGSPIGKAELAALFFALHPLRVESVAWISCRMNLLSAFFILLSVRFFLNHLERPRGRDLRFSFWAFVLSLFSKAWGVVLPPVFLVLDYYHHCAKGTGGGKNAPFLTKERMVRHAPFWLLSMAFGWLAVKAKADSNAVFFSSEATAAWLPHLKQAGLSLSFYIQKILWPGSLSPLYEMPLDFNQWSLWEALQLLAVFSLTGAAMFRFKRRPGLCAAWIIFVLLTLPISGIMQSGPQFAADRYTYLSGLPIALLLASLWPGDFKSIPRGFQNLIRMSPALVLLAFLSMTRGYAACWTSSENLWRRAVGVAPGSLTGRAHLAGALLEKGREKEARDLYVEIIEKDSGNLTAHMALGNLCYEQSRFGEAYGHFRLAAAGHSRHASPIEGMGRSLLALGMPEKAVPLFQKSIAFRPNYWEAFCDLGVAYLQMGQISEAKENLKKAESIFPLAHDVQNDLGLAALQESRPEEAVGYLSKAVDLKPDFAEGFSNLGYAHLKLHRHEEARAALETALVLNPLSAETLFNLALLERESDHDAAAARFLQESLSLKPELKDRWTALKNRL